MKRFVPGELIKMSYDFGGDVTIYKVLGYFPAPDSDGTWQFFAKKCVDKNAKKKTPKKVPIWYGFDRDQAPTAVPVMTQDGILAPVQTEPGPDNASDLIGLFNTERVIAVPPLRRSRPDNLETFWDNGDFVRARSQQVYKKTWNIDGDYED